MKKLRISDNNRYFENEDGTPFIWIADTAWTMPQRMKWDDVVFYMQKRKRQGFTVLQIVALDPEQDVQMRNPSGIKALNKDDLLAPNEEYFSYLDWIIDQAKEYGFYVLLLPVWGQLVVGHDWLGRTFEKTVHEENSYAYGQWIGNRYKDKENIIWCLGGDRQPVHLGVDYKNVWRNMAEGLIKGLTGIDLKYNEKSSIWKERMITYHACHEAETGECSTMSYWTDEEAWISFIMLQSGHGLKPKNYELVKKEYDREIVMPVWDGEPAYEKMPTSWPVVTDYHGDWIVRKRAYWSLFAGSFGHTYGHSSVWCMISEKETGEGREDTWFTALDSPGSHQMKILRDFLESRDLSSCIPSQEILLDQVGKETDVMDEHHQACREKNGDFLCVYFPQGGRETISLEKIKDLKRIYWWFNPRNGECTVSGEISDTEKVFLAETPSSKKEEDWILVIDIEKPDIEKPGISKEYGEKEKEVKIGKVFDWGEA